MKISKRTFIKNSTKLISISLIFFIFAPYISIFKNKVYKKKNKQIWILDLNDN